MPSRVCKKLKMGEWVSTKIDGFSLWVFSLRVWKRKRDAEGMRVCRGFSLLWFSSFSMHVWSFIRVERKVLRKNLLSGEMRENVR